MCLRLMLSSQNCLRFVHLRSRIQGPHSFLLANDGVSETSPADDSVSEMSWEI